MAAAARPGPFSTKPVEQLIESADTSKLRRAIGALDLTAFGVGAIMFSMSRDGVVPAKLGEVSERTRTPIFVTALFGVLIAVLAALVPLTEIAKLVNIGTLFAFLLVNVGVVGAAPHEA